jgi:hypothetical protein
MESKMKTTLIAAISLLICGSAMADTFYLHADLATGQSSNDKTLWYTAPTGGVTQASLGANTTGNQFDVNGFDLRSASTTGSSTFPGTFISDDASDNLVLMYASTWNVTGGFNVNNTLFMRPHRSTVNLNIGNLDLGSSGDMKIRGNGTKLAVNVDVANLTGSGDLSFGISSQSGDVNGHWGLSITDANSDFTGTVDLFRGALTFDTAFSLGDARFAIDSGEDNSVVLANSVSFGDVTFGASSLSIGTYDASQLNSELETDIFSGTGSLTVIPEPATLGLVCAVSAAMLFVRRIFLV